MEERLPEGSQDRPQNESITPEEARELGIRLFETGVSERDKEKQQQGIQLLVAAARLDDVEAMAMLGMIITYGFQVPYYTSTRENAENMLRWAAARKSQRARFMLNRICEKRYREWLKDQPMPERERTGPLVDFEGNRIVIDRTGILTPIDAVLEYVDGVNRLTFSLNLLFVDADLPDPESFESAVVTGILDWQGEYEVFGGQRLQVVVQITLEDRLTDNVMVIAMTEKNLALFQKVAGVVKTRAGEKNLDVMVRQKRSGAISGLRKWSTRSKKAILIVSEDGTFRDMYEIRAVAKHEFGHALGLGDLYFSPSDGLEGVQKGTYDELDSYYQGEKVYNLVMSNHHGAISNNDMEMVVLAFSEDRMQLYQKMPHQKGEISKALGRGN